MLIPSDGANVGSQFEMKHTQMLRPEEKLTLENKCLYFIFVNLFHFLKRKKKQLKYSFLVSLSKNEINKL